MELEKGKRRIPPEELQNHVVKPDKGISLFISFVHPLRCHMNSQTKSIQLTQLQISHTIVALQDHMKLLLKQAEESPEGGEHEDYLIAQSILKQLAAAKE